MLCSMWQRCSMEPTIDIVVKFTIHHCVFDNFNYRIQLDLTRQLDIFQTSPRLFLFFVDFRMSILIIDFFFIFSSIFVMHVVCEWMYLISLFLFLFPYLHLSKRKYGIDECIIITIIMKGEFNVDLKRNKYRKENKENNVLCKPNSDDEDFFW